MPTQTQNEAMAATIAERALADLLYHLTDDDGCVDVAEAVRLIVDSHTAAVDTCDGQRRLIFTGQWEVDPAALMAPLVQPVEMADAKPGRCGDCGDPLAWVGEPGSDRIHAWSGRLGMDDHPYDHAAVAPHAVLAGQG